VLHTDTWQKDTAADGVNSSQLRVVIPSLPTSGRTLGVFGPRGHTQPIPRNAYRARRRTLLEAHVAMLGLRTSPLGQARWPQKLSIGHAPTAPAPGSSAGGSPWRRLSRSQARTAWWCELAWPGQAAHLAGSFKYSYLSQRISVRAKPTSTTSPTSTSRAGFGTIFRYRNQMCDSAPPHPLKNS
jgi:hypothetical protein